MSRKTEFSTDPFLAFLFDYRLIHKERITNSVKTSHDIDKKQEKGYNRYINLSISHRVALGVLLWHCDIVLSILRWNLGGITG